MTRFVGLAGLVLVLASDVACGGRVQGDGSAGGYSDQGSGGSGQGSSSSGGAGSGGSGGSNGSGGSGGGGFGNFGEDAGGGPSAGADAGIAPPPAWLMNGQCVLRETGTPSFQEGTGVAGAVSEGSGHAADAWCDVVVDSIAYRLELRPTRDPEVPVTLHAQATFTDDGHALDKVVCNLQPYEDDATAYEVAFDCAIPPRGEDLPGSQVSGALYAHPIPDTLK